MLFNSNLLGAARTSATVESHPCAQLQAAGRQQKGRPRVLLQAEDQQDISRAEGSQLDGHLGEGILICFH
eukprot:1087886-Amphidinium_carterae.2